MLEMQNDVNRSSAKIVELKQEAAGLRSQLVRGGRAASFRRRLRPSRRLRPPLRPRRGSVRFAAGPLASSQVARDRMHADDARMRLQLGKRLQQLVFDNAALRRTCDDLERNSQKTY